MQAEVSATAHPSSSNTIILIYRLSIGIIADIYWGTGSGSLVDASGYKFSEKDTKPGKIKVKKTAKASAKKKADGTCLTK